MRVCVCGGGAFIPLHYRAGATLLITVATKREPISDLAFCSFNRCGDGVQEPNGHLGKRTGEGNQKA